MFFEVHPESKIAFKKLSKNDSGLNPTGNQTHIGLSNQLLGFMPNSIVERSALLVCDNYCDVLPCEYGKIHRKEGQYNSPNLKSGDKDIVTIVNKIREFVAKKPSHDWYLAWFGLKSQELVFWLMSDDSDDYLNASHLFTNTKLKVYGKESLVFDSAINFLENKINGVSVSLQKDLEISSMLGYDKKLFNPHDLAKAQMRFNQIGRDGEELVAQYLDRQKHDGVIRSYSWQNKSKESWLPYDFIIDGKLYVDVKSTLFDFDHNIYFSENELEFTLSSRAKNKYAVFRIFDIEETQKKLRVCRDCRDFTGLVHQGICDFHDILTKEKATVKNLNIAVKPSDCFVNIDPIIML